MGPDFLGNSCSNTLRSNCSQLKWPLMRQNNRTTNQCFYSCDVWIANKDEQKLQLQTINIFSFKTPHVSLPVAISPFLFPPNSLPLSSLFSFHLQQREKLQTACHPGNPAWSPEQLSNISLKLSLFLSLSLLFDHWAVRAEASALPGHTQQIYTS